MNDLHVESLRYSLEVDETHGRFDNPPPLVHETDAYLMRLEDGVLTVQMKEHHPTAESARARIEPDLKAWEMYESLKKDHRWFKFVFDPDGVRVIDRNLPPLAPGEARVQANNVLRKAIVSASVTVTPPSSEEYPKPPKAFRTSPEVEALFDRYLKDPLSTTGYACLSYIEGTTGLEGFQGARDAAVRKYLIDRPVLKTLGELTSTKGNIHEARKLDFGATFVPWTQAEQLWVRAAIKALIRRKAEYDHDPAAVKSPITMADLPPLEQ